MVQFEDNAVLAQLGTPDMRLCIEYALTYPKRSVAVCDELNWDKIDNISIGTPDLEAFPMLDLAIKCASIGKSAPCVYNAANEVAVALYLEDKIRFYDIYDICCKTVEKFGYESLTNLIEIEDCDKKAREYAKSLSHNYII